MQNLHLHGIWNVSVLHKSLWLKSSNDAHQKSNALKTYSNPRTSRFAAGKKWGLSFVFNSTLRSINFRTNCPQREETL